MLVGTQMNMDAIIGVEMKTILQSHKNKFT